MWIRCLSRYQLKTLRHHLLKVQDNDVNSRSKLGSNRSWVNHHRRLHSALRKNHLHDAKTFTAQVSSRRFMKKQKENFHSLSTHDYPNKALCWRVSHSFSSTWPSVLRLVTRSLHTAPMEVLAVSYDAGIIVIKMNRHATIRTKIMAAMVNTYPRKWTMKSIKSSLRMAALKHAKKLWAPRGAFTINKILNARLWFQPSLSRLSKSMMKALRSTPILTIHNFSSKVVKSCILVYTTALVLETLRKCERSLRWYDWLTRLDPLSTGGPPCQDSLKRVCW